MKKLKNDNVQPNDPNSIGKTKTLYDISREFSELEDLLESVDDDISAEQQTQIDEFLSGLSQDRDKKIDGYCGLIRDLNARGEARKAEAERFAKLAKYDENKVKRLKWVLLNFMQTHNVEKVETVRFKLRRSQNASAPVITCASTSSREPHMPTGLVMPSCPSSA